MGGKEYGAFARYETEKLQGGLQPSCSITHGLTTACAASGLPKRSQLASTNLSVKLIFDADRSSFTTALLRLNWHLPATLSSR